MMRYLIVLFLVSAIPAPGQNRLYFTDGSYVSIAGDKFYVGVEVNNMPVNPPGQPNVAVKSVAIPLDAFNYLQISQGNVLLHPPSNWYSSGSYECLFGLHLAPEEDAGGFPIMAMILGSNGETATSPIAGGYGYSLKRADRFLVVEIQATSSRPGAKCEMQVVGKLFKVAEEK